VPDPVDARLGARLAELRAEHGWSLGELAELSGVPVHPLPGRAGGDQSHRLPPEPPVRGVRTDHVPLLSEVEAEPALLVRAGEQPLWEDRTAGFVRRSVSPPHAGLRGELAEGLAHRRRRHRLRPAAGQLAMIDESPALRRYEESMWTRRSG
jgi:hypothetical protein